MHESYISFRDHHLGSVSFQPGSFRKEIFQKFENPSFTKKTSPEKHEIISTLLFQEILSHEGNVFLLPHVINYIQHVSKVLPTYTLASFEFWLNHHREASDEEKLLVRARIVGKHVPRMEYYRYFPQGEEGGSFFGPHYSIAHFSPDVDTTVASFSCFLNAFAARIGKARNHWVIPGGPPKESIEIDLLFHKPLSNFVFPSLAAQKKHLLITSLDLLKKKNMICKKLSESSSSVDHERSKNAVVLVDDEGCYKGDWRDVDVEAVSLLTDAILAIVTDKCNLFTQELVYLLAQEDLSVEDMRSFVNRVFNKKLFEGERTPLYSSKERLHLNTLLQKLLHVKNGCNATFGEFLTELRPNHNYSLFKQAIASLPEKDLFSANRSTTFTYLRELLSLEKESFLLLQTFLTSLETSLHIKEHVLGHTPTHISHLAEYEEIQKGMKQYAYLTVTYEDNGKLYPLGVIHHEDISRKMIASSSWNDFSNPFETDAREDVELISVIDHHKSILTSKKPFLALLRDLQSTNTICAQLSFDLNDLYSTNGMSSEEIEKEIKTTTNARILERLLKRKKIADANLQFYIARDREFLEYYQFLFAILDDTDLLTKVTPTDVDCVRDLINRLKSLMVRKEVEVVHFDDIARDDPLYAKKAAQKILRNEDVYSLYATIYDAKERLVNEIILSTKEGSDTAFFQDVKVLNGYAEVGQFKIFPKNEPILRKRLDHLRNLWLKRSQQRAKDNPDCSLFIFMLSTLSSAEELFRDNLETPTYKDELWFWVPEGNKKAAYQLASFLEEFRHSPHMVGQEWEIEFLGKDEGYKKAFADALQRPFISHHSRCELSAAIVKVPMKRIKSRKADIAVYLNAQ